MLCVNCCKAITTTFAFADDGVLVIHYFQFHVIHRRCSKDIAYRNYQVIIAATLCSKPDITG